MPLPPGVERESVPSLPASRPTHHASQLVSDNLDSSGRSAAACSNVAPHRPDGHKCEAVGGRIWSLALGGAVRTAYGLRLKLTNENPHKKLVSPSPAELTQLRARLALVLLLVFSRQSATREPLSPLGPALEDSDLGSLSRISRANPPDTTDTRHAHLTRRLCAL